MRGHQQKAYSTGQWVWAVNLVAVLGAIVFLLPATLTAPLQAASLLPYVLVIALVIAWVLVAPMLAYAMRKPASWLRAAKWGGFIAAGISLIGFAFATARRLGAQADPSFNYQIGGGEYVRDFDGVLTPYGWWILFQNNLLFIVLGICITLIVRAVIGPGKVQQ